MRSNRFARLLASAAIITGIGFAAAGCQTTQVADGTNSISLAPEQRSDADMRRDVIVYGTQYRANPQDMNVALHYAQALRGTGQYAQASAVLEQVSIRNPHNQAVLGEYGRALAEAGEYQQALQVLERATTPDKPDWHILSAQGAVLDQMGRHEEAQRHYFTALKIVPNEPSVLSNLGLSYALSKNFKNAETTLRRAAAQRAGRPARAAKSCAGGRPARPLRRSRDHRAGRSAARRGRGQCRLSAQDAGAQTTASRPRRETHGAQRRRIRSLIAAICSAITLIAAGPRMTTNSTGRKNTIIGTVSFGGRPAAFFSASDMRMSRFSCASTRSVVPSGVPYRSACCKAMTYRL